MHRTAAEGHRVLISAPYGQDGPSIAGLLSREGYDAALCKSLEEVAQNFDEHAGAIVLTEEALLRDSPSLLEAFASQQPWSDISCILLTTRHSNQQNKADARRRLPDGTSVVVLEKPLSAGSLISAVASAMRARQRQFQLRDHLRELEQQRLRLSSLLDNLPVGVAFLDRDGATLLSNPAFQRFNPSGRPAALDDDTVGDWIASNVNGSSIERNDFPSLRALRGEHGGPVEFRYTGFRRNDVWTRVSGIPLFDEKHEVVGAISVIVDIDDEKKAQIKLSDAANLLEEQVAARTAELTKALQSLRREAAERSRAEAALRHAQKMEAVGQLTGGIAHDFNNMLTGVIGSIDIMKRRMAANRYDDLPKFMETASASAHRAASLTSRLLAFSRRQSLDSKPTDINSLVSSLSDLLSRTMTEKIAVAINVAPGSLWAIVDANQLESAVLNLAINARDAMPDGGELRISSRAVDVKQSSAEHLQMALDPGAYVAVTVADTGVGMDEEVLENAFNPFFTTKPVGHGTGLGLSMVYGFAKQSNGGVRITSTPGIGTEIEILLPATDESASANSDADQIGAVEGSGQNVLMVEDDRSVRLLIRDVLEELGYAAFEASDGPSAMRLLEGGITFDLMISDVGLPGMNGRQLAELARERYPHLPILFVTGYAENAATRADFLGTNMAMIKKPFALDELAAKISEMLEGRVVQ